MSVFSRDENTRPAPRAPGPHGVCHVLRDPDGRLYETRSGQELFPPDLVRLLQDSGRFTVTDETSGTDCTVEVLTQLVHGVVDTVLADAPGIPGRRPRAREETQRDQQALAGERHPMLQGFVAELSALLARRLRPMPEKRRERRP